MSAPRRLDRALAAVAAVALLTLAPVVSASSAWAVAGDRAMDAAVTSSGATRTLLTSTLAYVCVADEDGAAKPYNAELSVAAPAELGPGERAEVELSRFTGFFDRWTDDPVTAGQAEISAQVLLGGPGAAADSATLTGVSVQDSPARTGLVPELLPVEFGAVTGSVQAGTREGALTFAPGPVTITVTQSRGVLTTVCAPREDTEPVATTRVVDADRPAEPEGTPPRVSVPGRVEWTGTYRCVSSDPALQPDFDTPASVTVSTGDGAFAVGERIEVVGEFTLERGPGSPLALGAGGVTAELSVPLSGSAVAERNLVLRTENTEDLPAGQDLLLPAATGSLTASREGAVGLAVGGLELSILAGLVTVDCRVQDADTGPPAAPEPSERPAVEPSAAAAPERTPAPGAVPGALPATGAALTGLLAAGALTLAAGGAVLLLSRGGRRQPRGR